MRLWTLHPKYLDSKGLVALWREALLAQSIFKGHTKAYARHPQLIRFRQSRTPIKSIAAFLRIVHAEGSRRGFKFNIDKIGRGGCVECIAVTRGQIKYEWDHFMAKLLMRDTQRFNELKAVRKIDPNPLFKIIQGGVEEWEKIKTPPNNRLKLTAPSVHASCLAAVAGFLAGGKKRAPRPAA